MKLISNPVFAVGILIRLLIIPYTDFIATWAKIDTLNAFVSMGLNPLIHTFSFGPGFWLFYLPCFAPYLIANTFGIYNRFIIVSLFKVPPLLGDIFVFYAIRELALIVSKDEKKSLFIASVYFLNPYVIWMSSVIGHSEQLMVGLILLSTMFLVKGKISLSAICLGISIFTRYLPLLLVPTFFLYLWRKEALKGVARFAKWLLVVIVPLTLPYVHLVLSIYSSRLDLFTFLRGWLLAVSPPAELPVDFPYNFTSFLVEAGVWPYVSSLFSYLTFLPLYAVLLIYVSRRSVFSLRSLNQFALGTFSLFVLITPLIQHNYLLMILPFLLLESFLFSNSLPRYYFHAMWILWMLMDFIMEGAFLWYPAFDGTRLFEDAFRAWAFRNYPLKYALSVLSGLLLVLIAEKSFTKPVRALAHRIKIPLKLGGISSGATRVRSLDKCYMTEIDDK